MIGADIKSVFASVDSVEDVASLKEGLRVGFPMLAELDVEQVADATGAFVQRGERPMVHATGFLLRPNGEVASATYSTGPVGRITASDVLRVVAFLRSRE